MPAKYHIHIQPTAPRFPAHGKGTVLDWGEGCIRCTRCVKETCPYHAFDQRGFDQTSLTDTIDSVCKNCFRCVQGCPRELVQKTLNPQYEGLGDDYWTPEILLSTWYQAETGKIPVSGAGYGGPFSGEGFDSIWTDMSEIVRPTRDGIHGREYISTAIDLGRHPLFLAFDDQGDLAFEPAPLLEIPLPVLLSEPPLGAGLPRVLETTLRAGKSLGTLTVVTRSRITQKLAQSAAHLVPSYTADTLELDDPLLKEVRLVEILDSDGVVDQVANLKHRHPQVLCLVKVPADGRAANRAAELAGAGAEIIHLAAGPMARGYGEAGNLHLKDLIRRTHLRLVEMKLRDTMTLSGLGRHRHGRARGQGHHLRGRRRGGGYPAARRPGVPDVQEVPQGRVLSRGHGKTGGPKGRPAPGEPHGGLEQPAPGSDGSHGTPGGAPPPGGSGPGHVCGRPAAGDLCSPVRPGRDRRGPPGRGIKRRP